MDGAPSLNLRLKREGHELAAAGAWTAVHAGNLEAVIGEAAERASAVRDVSVDMHDVGAFDTFGAWLLERFVRERARAGLHTQSAWSTEYQGLLRDVHDANREEPRKTDGAGLPRPFQRYADGVVWFRGRYAPIPAHARRHRLGHTPHNPEPQAFPPHLGSPPARPGRLAGHADLVLITFLIGCIIAQQGFFHFRKFGAENYVVDMVGILISREIGVLLVAIIVAGCSGSSYTAELAPSKMREEIDALRTMGLDPVEVLILPRVLALVVAMPVLTFLA